MSPSSRSSSCAPCLHTRSNLSNKAELGLQVVGCPPQLNEAQLLLHLYAAMGLDMLGRLQGQYAFCLYDSKQVCTLGWRLAQPACLRVLTLMEDCMCV